MAWHGMVWYGMVSYGMVWYGMVWYEWYGYGMVWYGLVWYGIELYCTCTAMTPCPYGGGETSFQGLLPSLLALKRKEEQRSESELHRQWLTWTDQASIEALFSWQSFQNTFYCKLPLMFNHVFLSSASIERFINSLMQQKVQDNIVQDQPAGPQQPSYMQNPNGPWYQNGWTYTKTGMVPYQNPPGWKRG